MRYWVGDDDVGLVGGAIVLIVAALLAWLSTRLVETPFRRWDWLVRRPLLSVVLSLVLLLIPAVAAYGWSQQLQGRIDSALTAWRELHAAATPVVPAGTVIPAPVMIRQDRPGEEIRLCNQGTAGGSLISCAYGDVDGDVTIVSVGGSHVSQWVRVLNQIGKEKGYRIVNMTKDGCTFTVGKFLHRSCPVWNKRAMAAIIELKPDLVFAMGTRATRNKWVVTSETVPTGYQQAFAQLAEHGIPVLGLRDNPWFGFDVAQCVSSAAAPWARCGRPRDEVLRATSPTAGVDAPNVHFADLTDLYCDDAFCPAVRDGILVYRDRHHLTTTYTFVHKHRLETAIEDALKRFAP